MPRNQMLPMRLGCRQELFKNLELSKEMVIWTRDLINSVVSTRTVAGSFLKTLIK